MPSAAYVRALEAAQQVQSGYIAVGNRKAALQALLRELLRLSGSDRGLLAAAQPRGAAWALQPWVLEPPQGRGGAIEAPAAPLGKGASDVWLHALLGGREAVTGVWADAPCSLTALLPDVAAKAPLLALPIADEHGATGLALLAGRKGGYARVSGDALAPLLRTGALLLAAPARAPARALDPAPAQAPHGDGHDGWSASQRLLEALPHGVLVLQGERVAYANRAAARLLGFDTPARLQALEDLQAWIDPEHRQVVRERLRACLDGATAGASFELRAAGHAGAAPWLQCSVVAIPWQDAPALALALVDITERQRTSSELERQQRVLRTVFEAFPQYLYIKDRDGRYAMVNRTLAEASCKRPEEMVGLTADDLGFMTAEERIALQAQDRQVLGRGRPVGLEEFHLTLPGGVDSYQTIIKYPLKDEQGRVEGLVGFGMDVTHLVLARREAQANLRLLRAVLDNLPHGVAVKDGEGRLTVVNPAYARLFAGHADALIGKRVRDLNVFSGEPLHAIEAADREVVETGRNVELPEQPRRAADGTLRSEHVYKSPLPGPAGRPVGSITIVVDITARVEAERKLRDSELLLRTVLDMIPHNIYAKDTRGRFILANQSFERTMGLTAAQLYGLRLADISYLDEASRRVLEEMDRRALETGLAQELPAQPLPQSDGSIKIRHIHKAPLPDARGGVAGVVAIAIDVTERAQAEQDLRDSQHLLRTVLDTIPHSIVVQDLEGRFLMVNRTFAQRSGIAADRLIGMRMLELDYLSMEYRRSLEESDQRVLSSGAAVELPDQVSRRSDGTTNCRHVYKAPLSNAAGQVVGVVSLAIDVTDRVLAEQRVQASQRLLQTVFDTVPHVVTVKDREGRYLMTNPAYRTLFGVDPQGLLGVTARELPEFDPESRAGIAAMDEEVLSGRAHSVHVEHELHLGDGRTVYLDTHKTALLDEAGRVIGLVGIGVDVTPRHEAEAREQLALARLRDAIESLPAVFMLFDAQERLVLWNSQIVRSFPEFQGRLHEGMPYEEVATITAFQADPVERNAYVAERLRDFRGTVEHGTRQRADGRWTQFLDRRTSDGGTVSLRFDVTEQKLRDQELRQAQKMEAVGQLTGGVAHDFNNLLTVVLGNLELLKRQMPARDKASELIERAIAAGERGAALTQRLLAFSRSQTLRPRLTDLNELVQGIHDLLRRTLGETIDVAIQLAPGLWPTVIDPTQLENALLNLAINARDAMPNGGRLAIETRNEWLDEAYAASNTDVNPGAYALLTVSDSGSGISHELLERVFDPFFTTKEVGKGSGLGLSMVYGFVKQSAGHIRLYSEIGKGTSVRLYLPRAQADAAADEPPEGRYPAPRGQSQLLLVVEDDPHISLLARDMLHELGYRTLLAHDAASAIELLNREPDVAALFTDVVLPGGSSGIDLADRAQRVRPGIKVLFTTGYTERELMRRSLIHHGALLLEKPYRRQELAERLQRVLQGAGAAPAGPPTGQS
jgi:PAS domain S-box-containing protein